MSTKTSIVFIDPTSMRIYFNSAIHMFKVLKILPQIIKCFSNKYSVKAKRLTIKL